MAEPATRTSGVPNFHDYSREPHAGAQSGINQAAQRVGGAVGTAAGAARNLPRQIGSTLHSVKDRLEVVKGRGLREANALAAEFRQAAEETAGKAQEKARWAVREYPLQVIAGVAALAFAAGFALRVWRGSRG